MEEDLERDDGGDDTPRSERWPLRPVLLAALGAAAGLAVHFILGPDLPRDLPALRMAALGFVVVAAGLTSFTLERRRWPLTLAFSIVCGAIAAGVLYWNGDTGSWTATEHWRVVSLALGLAIATPLFQAARDSGALRVSYAQVHDHAWIDAVLWCACWAFVGISVLLLILLGMLFGLIGMTFLTDLLRDSWFDQQLVGLSFGAAIGLFREHDQVVRMAQRVISTVLAVLAPVLALGLLLFLLALPFTGLHALWDATKATTPILLACAIGALILANTVLGSAPEEEARNWLVRFGGMALGLVVLPLAVLAAVATGLRIEQYGFTPDRLWALAFVVMACVIGVAYLADLAIGRLDWGRRVRPANLVLALVIGVVALVLATPLLDFNRISTADQVARLEAGRIAPDKFDWAALAFDFGAPGKAAVRRLRATKDPKIADLADKADKAPTRWALADAQWARARKKVTKLKLRVLPAGHSLPDALQEKLSDQWTCRSDGGCTLAFLPGDKDAVLLAQACFAAPAPAAAPSSRVKEVECKVRVTEIPDCSNPRRFVLTDKGWSEPSAADRAPADQSALAAGYRDGRFEVRKVQQRQIFIAGVPVGDPFE